MAVYNADKKGMKARIASDNDIIHLNVGGQKLTTKRSTLCQIENSLLATMFSGRSDDSLERDRDGAVFLDFNPQHFVLILEYLRGRKIAQPGQPRPLPKVADDQLEHFNNLLQYLGLSDERISKATAPREKFKLHSPGITVREIGTVAVHGPDAGYKFVLGENIYRQGIVNFRLKLESFQHNDWMFVGVARGDVNPPNTTSHRWRGSYGWRLGAYGQEWRKGGSFSVESALDNVVKQGDTVVLVLNCDVANLSLHVPTGERFQIDIPERECWRLNVNMRGENDQIRILNA